MGIMDLITSPVSSLLGSAIGAFTSSSNQQATNEMQMQMMAQQNAFQEKMSNTAYQRASSDMQAAGLNPMMMFNSGSAASTPSGASPSAAVKGSGPDPAMLEKAVSSATQARVANATIDNLVEQNAKIKAETLTEGERPSEIMVRKGLMHTQGDKNMTENERTRASIPIVVNEALTAKNESSMSPDARRLLDVGGYAGKKGSDILSPVGNLASSAKAVKYLLPSHTKTERTNSAGGSTFEERWSSH